MTCCRTRSAVVFAALGLLLQALPAAAAPNKEHLQLLAEIRMLQEQQQQLQALVGSLQDTLKALSTKLDDQAAVTRKAMADQTLAVTNIGDNVRVLREKTDETNVRISSVSQEIDALRQAMMTQPPAQAAGPQPPGSQPGANAAPGQTPPASPATAAAPPLSPTSPQRMYDSSFDDYTAGRFDLAIDGFQKFIATFPRLPQAADAQYNIGMSYYEQGKWTEARDAFQKIPSEFQQQAQGTVVADSYYKLGMTYERLNQIDNAKRAYETAVQKYPNTMSATMAGQALQRLNRR
jgi:tol-pal system protein YbgF